MEKTYKLLIEYDGTDFCGWQVQRNPIRTVQGVLENAIETVSGKKIRIAAAGRTDTGVHASGQVASLRAEIKMPPERFLRALNGNLPDDVTVIGMEEMQDRFNARFDAVSRTYRYTMADRRVSIGKKYSWHVKYRISRELLEHSTKYLAGECNLRGFSKGDDSEDFSTYIYDNFWKFDGNIITFEIRALRFFQHSVRSIVGTAVSVARGKSSPDVVKDILLTGDKKLAGPTAPPEGLCLIKVEYGANNEQLNGFNDSLL